MIPRRAGARFSGPILLILLIIVFYWKFTLSGQYELMWSPDQAQQIVPWMHAAARQWSSGTLPLWDPHMWGGQPLLGQAQPGIAYFLNWLLFSIPLKNGFFSSDILHWYFAAIHYMAALFCYLVCRDLGRSVPASVIAGLIFSLTSYVGVTGWPQMLNGAVWAPLVFLFLLRALRDRRPLGSAALSGLCLGISWLSGHHQVPLILSLAAAATWAVYALRGRRLDRRVVQLAAIAFVICGLTGALQILPAREYGQHALRWVSAAEPVGWNDKVPYTVHETFSMAPSSFLGIVLPGFATVSESFVGFMALTLALIGAASRWRNPRVRLFSFLGVAGFVYALGANTVFEGIVYSLVPMVEKARTPAAAICLFGLAASVLAGFGIDTLGRRAGAAAVQRSFRLLGMAGAFLAAALFAFTLMKIGVEQRIALAAITALLTAALMAGIHHRALRFRHAALLCGLLVLMEAGSVMVIGAAKHGNLMSYIQSMRGNKDIAAYLHKQPQPLRIAMIGEDIPGNWAEYHNLDALTGYLASISVNMTTVAAHNRNVQLLWGTRYSMAKQAETAEDRDVFTGQSGRKLFERDNAFPRSWVIHGAGQAPSRKKINEAVEADLPAFARRALMTSKPPALEECAGSEAASYERPAADTVVVKAKLACKGMVVVSDAYFPGWKAEIDSQAAEIHEVNGAMRGVVVPAGEHTITMRYRPGTVYAGALLSLLGVIAAFGIRTYEARRL